MKNLIATTITAASLATLGLVTPVLAKDKDENRADWKADGEVTVVERNKKGKATRVRIDGQELDVCTTQHQDNCINPRAAGLNWGDHPLMSYPENKKSK